jgi:hypothetical protein
MCCHNKPRFASGVFPYQHPLQIGPRPLMNLQPLAEGAAPRKGVGRPRYGRDMRNGVRPINRTRRRGTSTIPTLSNCRRTVC